MNKPTKPNLTPEEGRARILAAANKSKPAYDMPEVCAHGFAAAEADGHEHRGIAHQGCPCRA